MEQAGRSALLPNNGNVSLYEPTPPKRSPKEQKCNKYLYHATEYVL